MFLPMLTVAFCSVVDDSSELTGRQRFFNAQWTEAGSYLSTFCRTHSVRVSVADPWHFGTDPDPRIHTKHTSGSGFGSGSCYFLSFTVPSKHQQKTNFSIKVFLLVTFWSYITSFFKDKKSKRSHNQVFFLLFLLDDFWIRIRTSD